MADVWQDSSTRAWVTHVLDDMVPKMTDSACVVQIMPDKEGDVKFWVELGASIMMDKPIIAVTLGDRAMPPKLAAIADEVVRCPDGIDPATSEQLAQAVQRILARLP